MDRHRWLAASLYKAFLQAKRLSDAEFAETTALKIGLPWLNAEYEATRRGHGAGFLVLWRGGKPQGAFHHGAVLL